MSIDQLQDSPEVGKANTVCCRLTCHVLLRPCCSVLVLDMHLEASVSMPCVGRFWQLLSPGCISERIAMKAVT